LNDGEKSEQTGSGKTHRLKISSTCLNVTYFMVNWMSTVLDVRISINFSYSITSSYSNSAEPKFVKVKGVQRWNFITVYGGYEPSRNRVDVHCTCLPGYIGWRK
jgi:hypothetical protein